MSNPFLEHVGIDTDGDPSILTDERHANRAGGVQGGLIATLLDAAMGDAVHDGLEEGQQAATVQLTITYLNPGKPGDTLSVTAEVRKRGGKLVMVEGDITDQDGEAIAHGVATFAISRSS
ncbi:MAG: PaaI family thioesterase [Brachybacterium sp.]|nr:PaaI family thioesterase [Brachybacterium sp.]